MAAPPLRRGWPVPGRRRSLGWPGAWAVLPPPLPLGRGLVAAAAVCDAARPGLPSAAVAASGGLGLLAVSPPPRVAGVCCHRIWVGSRVKAKGRKPWSVCRPVTATPEGVAYLVEGVTLSPIPSSSVSFPGENLDHVGRTTTAPFASLPRWRRCLGCSCRWLSIALLGRIRFCACLCLVPLHRPGRVGRRLAVALLPYCSGGCFAAVVVGWSSLRADALPPLLIGRVDALPP